MFQIIEFDHRSQLPLIKEPWERLVNAHDSLRITDSFQWFEDSLDQHSQQIQPRIFLVKLAGKDIGIFPLMQHRIRTALGRMNVLKFAETNHHCCAHPIGHNVAATITAVFRYLHHQGRSWDYIDLNHLKRRSLDQARILTAIENMGWNYRCQRISESDGVRYMMTPYTHLRASGLITAKKLHDMVITGSGTSMLTRPKPQFTRTINQSHLTHSQIPATPHTLPSSRSGEERTALKIYQS